MKKTTLFLLSSVSVMIGCYSSPEMNEKRFEQMYIESTATCRQPEESYQHTGLRSCLEERIAWDNSHKKTVRIIPSDNGLPLVIPKTYDDDLMVEENRVYEVVEHNSNTVVVNDSADVSGMNVKNETVTYETVTEVVEKDNDDETGANDDMETTVGGDTQKVTVSEDKDCIVDGDSSEDGCVIEEEVEIVECIEEDACDHSGVVTTQETQTTTTVSSNGSDGVKGLTLVMGPIKEELVISVKSAETQNKQQVVETKKTVENVTKVKTTQKNEKEVLPLEEK